MICITLIGPGANLIPAAEYEYEDNTGWESAVEEDESEEERNQQKQKALKHFKLGKKYQTDQKYHKAIREYQRALALNPDMIKARRVLVWAKRDLARQRRFQTSSKENTLEALVKEAKDHYKRGRKYERENTPLEAAAEYKEAIRIIPGYPEAKEALRGVQAQRTLAPLPPAVTAAGSKALPAYQPVDMTSRYKVPASRQQRSSKAQQSIRAAIQKHYLQGCQMMDHGEYSTAIKEFELILEFEPEHREAQHKLNVAKKRHAVKVKKAKREAALAQSKGDTMGALSALRDIVNIDPTNEEALEAWEKIKRENKGIVDEIYRKGVKVYAKGYYTKALQAWELVLDIDPQNKKARENIKKVRQKMELMK
ncbi:tetratricopeptide repeat protein [bacterium]|nr:tetratricopeptide repeat protein [bacterium]